MTSTPSHIEVLALCENLEERRSRMTEVSAGMLVNPDGPEAAKALRAMAARVAEMEGLGLKLWQSVYDDTQRSPSAPITLGTIQAAEDMRQALGQSK